VLKGDSYRLKDKQQEVTAATETTRTAQNSTGDTRAGFNRR
jgi:hypothetical protein